jgi:hypothetical protein
MDQLIDFRLSIRGNDQTHNTVLGMLGRQHRETVICLEDEAKVANLFSIDSDKAFRRSQGSIHVSSAIFPAA